MCSSITTKSAIRLNMKKLLTTLNKETIDEQSKYITDLVISMPVFVNSTRIGLYLSMPEEVRTDELVKHVLNNGKECYIPRYNSSDMEMVKLNSIEDFNNLPKNKWNIRQPLLNEMRENAYKNGGLDLIITPGLAFTANGKRLGRGKGYYDRYLQEMKLFREKCSKQLFTIGISFTEQILVDIPVFENDFILDQVLYKQ